MIRKTFKVIALGLCMITAHNLYTADNVENVQAMRVKHESNEVNTIETIKESFIITSVENGIIRGEQISGKGEGIYYILNELDINERDIFSQLDVNDLVMIEWTKENYNNNEWNEIERVVYNSNGNKEGNE